MGVAALATGSLLPLVANASVSVGRPAAVAEPLSIVVQPVGGVARAGRDVVLSVAATGASGYQWTRDGVEIPDATSSTLRLPSIGASAAGSYVVAVSNRSATAHSQPVTLTVIHDEDAPAPTSLTISTLAGVAPGNRDGTGAEARFWMPHSVVVDSAGNAIVTDANHATLRKITPAGVVSVYAGTPGEVEVIDGDRITARLGVPDSPVIDPQGNVLVLDFGAIRQVSPSGAVRTLIPIGIFDPGSSMAIDASGTLFVCERQKHSISRVKPDGTIERLAGGRKGSADGSGSAAEFNLPQGIAADRAGNVYVVDAGNYTVRKITAAGVVTTLAGKPGESGHIDDTGSAARFWSPYGVAVDASGTLFVTETATNVVRQVTPSGQVTTYAGSIGKTGSADGWRRDAQFASPRGIALAPSGDLILTDYGNHVIRKISLAGRVSTLAGTARVGTSDGEGSAARFQGVNGIATDALGNLYVADQLNNTIRQITRDGVVRTLAGVPDGRVGYQDGSGASARFWWPFAVAVDRHGRIYVADKMNNVIRRITPTGEVSTYAGVPFPTPQGALAVGSQNPGGSADGPVATAQFYGPAGVAVDEQDNVYVADQQNCTIRKITADGMVRTLAGTPGQAGSADGVGPAARFDSPTGIAVDPKGVIYVADQQNHTVRKITPEGMVTTLAGNAEAGEVVNSDHGSLDGIGANARFSHPTGVAVDPAGRVYVADYLNNAVRLIQPNGRVTTLAGIATSFSRGVGAADGTGANARFYHPVGIAVDTSGTVFVSDRENNTIRKGLVASHAALPVVRAVALNRAVSVGESAAVSIGVGQASDAVQWSRNGVGLSGATFARLEVPSVRPADAGLYRARVTNEAGSTWSDPVIVGLTSTIKVSGSGEEVLSNVYVEKNGNTFDQVLATGGALAVTADRAENQITRTSFIDLDGDIVQVEFSGPGTLSLVLDAVTGPATAERYNQTTRYMTGQAGIVIMGANEHSNVSVFSVGRATAVNQTLFKNDVEYDGIADIAFIAIATTNGRFGGVRTANANYFAAKGVTGLYAPGVAFAGPVYIGDLSSYDEAQPVLVVGSASDVRITGGDLLQENARPVQVEGAMRLVFTDGADSHGRPLPAQTNRAVFRRDGEDVTKAIAGSP